LVNKYLFSKIFEPYIKKLVPTVLWMGNGFYSRLVSIRKASSSEWINVVVMGGFALVNSNKITILVNEAELGSV
jgi:hypothetical protein